MGPIRPSMAVWDYFGEKKLIVFAYSVLILDFYGKSNTLVIYSYVFVEIGEVLVVDFKFDRV